MFDTTFIGAVISFLETLVYFIEQEKYKVILSLQTHKELNN